MLPLCTCVLCYKSFLFDSSITEGLNVWENLVWFQKYPYPAMTNMTILTRPFLRKCQNALPFMSFQFSYTFNSYIIFKNLSNFSINLLAFYHKCRTLIGYANHYLFCDRYLCSSVLLLTKWRPLFGVIEVSVKKI